MNQIGGGRRRDDRRGAAGTRLPCSRRWSRGGIQATLEFMGEDVDLGAFEDLLVSARDDMHRDAAGGKFTPAVDGVERAQERMAAATKEGYRRGDRLGFVAE